MKYFLSFLLSLSSAFAADDVGVLANETTGEIATVTNFFFANLHAGSNVVMVPTNSRGIIFHVPGPLGGGTVGGYTNTTVVTNQAFAFNFIEGANITMLATNRSGTVDVQIAASLIGGAASMADITNVVVSYVTANVTNPILAAVNAASNSLYTVSSNISQAIANNSSNALYIVSSNISQAIANSSSNALYTTSSNIAQSIVTIGTNEVTTNLTAYIQSILGQRSVFYFRSSITNTEWGSNATYLLSAEFSSLTQSNTSYLLTNGQYAAGFWSTNQLISAVTEGSAVVDFDANITSGSGWYIKPEIYIITNGTVMWEAPDVASVPLTTTITHYRSIVPIATNFSVPSGGELAVKFKCTAAGATSPRLQIFTGSNYVGAVQMPAVVVATTGITLAQVTNVATNAITIAPSGSVTVATNATGTNIIYTIGYSGGTISTNTVLAGSESNLVFNFSAAGTNRAARYWVNLNTNAVLLCWLTNAPIGAEGNLAITFYNPTTTNRTIAFVSGLKGLGSSWTNPFTVGAGKIARVAMVSTDQSENTQSNILAGVAHQ